MRSLLLVLIFSLGALPPAISAEDPPQKGQPTPKATPKVAKKFAHIAGKYRIAFPAKPTLREQKIPVGNDDVVMYVASVEHEKAVYFVGWNAMPKITEVADQANILKIAEKATISDGKKISAKALEYGPGKVPAREVVWNRTDGLRCRALLLYKDERLYQVVFAGTKEQVASDEAKAFQNSLEFTEPEK